MTLPSQLPVSAIRQEESFDHSALKTMIWRRQRPYVLRSIVRSAIANYELMMTDIQTCAWLCVVCAEVHCATTMDRCGPGLSSERHEVRGTVATSLPT